MPIGTVEFPLSIKEFVVNEIIDRISSAGNESIRRALLQEIVITDTDAENQEENWESILREYLDNCHEELSAYLQQSSMQGAAHWRTRALINALNGIYFRSAVIYRVRALAGTNGNMAPVIVWCEVSNVPVFQSAARSLEGWGYVSRTHTDYYRCTHCDAVTSASPCECYMHSCELETDDESEDGSEDEDCEECEECGELDYECECREEDGVGRLHQYSFKAERSDRAFARAANEQVDKHTMFFGVELETTAKLTEELRRAISGIAFACSDGSLCRGGYELKTIPATLRWHYAHWRSLFSAMAGKGEHESCGMHVHISRAAFGKLTLSKLLYLMSQVSRQEALTVFGREPNTYCATIPEGDYKGYTGRRLARVIARLRYSSVNTQPDETIEFRCFSSTSDRREFIGRLELCSAIVRFCCSTPVQKISWQNFRSFCAEHVNEYYHLGMVVGLKKTKGSVPGAAVSVKGRTVECPELDAVTKSIGRNKSRKIRNKSRKENKPCV